MPTLQSSVRSREKKPNSWHFRISTSFGRSERHTTPDQLVHSQPVSNRFRTRFNLKNQIEERPNTPIKLAPNAPKENLESHGHGSPALRKRNARSHNQAHERRPCRLTLPIPPALQQAHTVHGIQPATRLLHPQPHDHQLLAWPHHHSAHPTPNLVRRGA